MKKTGTYILIFLLILVCSKDLFAASEFQQKALLQRYFSMEEVDWDRLTKENKDLIDDNLNAILSDEYYKIIKACDEYAEKNKTRRSIPQFAYLFANLGDYISYQLNKKATLRLDLARQYIKDGNLSLAADICNTILMKEPKNVEVATLKADLFYKMVMMEEAFNSYEYLLKIDKDNESALYHMGILYVNLNQYDKAADYFKKLLKVNPGHADAKRYLDLYEGKTSYTGGRKINEVAMQHFLSAEKLFTAEKYSEAADEYSLAIENDPYFYKAYVFLGESLARLKRYDESIDILQNAIKVSPQEPEAYHFLGLSLEKQYNYDPKPEILKKAVDNYQKALEVAPSYTKVQEDLERAKKRLEGKNAG